MLNERERRVLARIERQLIESDPALARLFAGAALSRDAGSTPTTLLVAGLALLVLGSLVGATPVALAGMTLSMLALVLAYATPGGLGRPFTA